MAGNLESTKILEDIGEVLKNSQNNLTKFKNAITNAHVIVFLGNTRSGKSTLVNYIIGTKLESFEERRPIYKIRKVNEQDVGPVIGQGSQSCTTIPGIYPLNQYGIIIIDAPGFDDNRSESQDIINALYINQIQYAKTVKFVLVSDINELVVDNIKGFTDLLEKTHALFPNFESLKTSVSIVFTKDYRNYLQSDIALLLKRKIIDVDSLYINKQLVQYFIENNDLIALFKMPSGPGLVTNEIDVNIEDARVTSCALLLTEACFKTALSSKSRLVLLKIYQKYLDSAYFDQELQSVLNNFSNYFCIDDYVFASTDGELGNVNASLRQIFNLFNHEQSKDFLNMSDIKHSLNSILCNNISQRFLKTFNVLVMIDSNLLMEDAIRNKFITKYKNSLKEVLSKVEKLRDKIDTETGDRRKSREVFKISASTAAAGGSAAVAGEVMRAFTQGSRLAPFGILGILGAIVTGVSAGVAATSYVVQNANQEKRIKARREQNRVVYENMFEDD